MSVQRIGAELPLVTVTLWLESAGVAMLIAWVRRAVEGNMQQIGALRSAALIVRFTAAVVVLHGMEILLWACFYRWRCLPSWDSAIYFSASSYSTLGCNDVSLPSNWRTLGPLESITTAAVNRTINAAERRAPICCIFPSTARRTHAMSIATPADSSHSVTVTRGNSAPIR